MIKHLNHECINQIEVEVKIVVTIEAGLDLITSIEVIWDIIKILGVEQHIVSVTEVVMATMHDAIKGMEEITIMEEAVTEIKLITEEGVGHLKDRIEVGEMTEEGVTVDRGQVLG